MANGTHFPATSSGTFSIPGPGTGTEVVGGWVNLPASPANETAICFTNGGSAFGRLVYLTAYKRYLWDFDWADGGGGIRAFTASSGWIWFAVKFTTTGGTVYWRRQDCFELSSTTFSWSHASAAISATIYAFLGDCQHFFVYQGTPSDADLLAWSREGAEHGTCYEYWSLNANSGTGAHGHNITLSNTTTASSSAPTVAAPTPDPTLSTLLSQTDSLDSVSTAGAVLTSPTSVTLSGWFKFFSAVTASPDSYYVTLYLDANNYVTIYRAYNYPADDLTAGIGWKVSGSQTDYCMSSIPTSLADAAGWHFVAFTFVASGGNTTITQYQAINEGTLVAPTTASNVVTGQVLTTSYKLGVGWRLLGPTNNGYVQHVRLYQSAKTLSEMAAIYKKQSADLTARGHWPLCACQISDVSGNGLDLTASTGDLFIGVAGPTLDALEPLSASIDETATGSATEAIGSSQSQIATLSEVATGVAIEALAASQSQIGDIAETATGSAEAAALATNPQLCALAETATGTATTDSVASQTQNADLQEGATGSATESLSASYGQASTIVESATGAAVEVLTASQSQVAALVELSSGAAVEALTAAQLSVYSATLDEIATGTTLETIGALQPQLIGGIERASGSSLEVLAAQQSQPADVLESATGSATESLAVSSADWSSDIAETATGFAFEDIALTQQQVSAIIEAATGSATEFLYLNNGSISALPHVLIRMQPREWTQVLR